MKTAVDVVIPTCNTRELLRQCLESLPGESARVARVVVVDNASSDGTPEMLARSFPSVELVRNDQNLGFATAANRGAHRSGSPYLLVLNSDAQLEPGSLEALRGVLDERSQVGIAGAQVLDPDGSFQASHAPFPSLLGELLMLTAIGRLVYGPWYPSRRPTGGAPVEADYVSGACLLIRRSAFDAVGGFDESYFLYAEEVDLCRRLRDAGWQVLHVPQARCRHVGGASSAAVQRQVALYRGRVQYFRKHQGPASTAALKALILASVAIKRLTRDAVRLASGGRRGRQVPELRTVRAALRGV